jgi:hypothetical protein
MKRSIASALFASVLVLAQAPAQAALGGLAAAVAADAQTLHGTAQAPLPADGYTRYAISLGAGAEVAEFADTGGLIFAVSWNSPVLPDMATLLGAYHARLLRAQGERRPAAGDAMQAPAGRRHFSAHAGDLVIESHGHLRGYYGLAYLPRSLPAGVQASALQ